MTNRIFFISDRTVFSGELLPSAENICYSVLVNPEETGSLKDAYAELEQTTHSPLALTLDIKAPLTTENIQFITSFLFIPSYLTLEYRPVIILKGSSPELAGDAEGSLSLYFSLQGIRKPVFYLLQSAENRIFYSVESLTTYYRDLLQNGKDPYENAFFYAASGEMLRSAFSSLQAVEQDFAHAYPQLYLLTRDKRNLEKELQSVRRRLSATETELDHQKQYVEILQSGHATKALQDFYMHEYEILPLWYKRFGHILKVFSGKRTFRSLFRDGVKKYKA